MLASRLYVFVINALFIWLMLLRYFLTWVDTRIVDAVLKKTNTFKFSDEA